MDIKLDVFRMRIREALKKRGMNQVRLAEKVGAKPQSISQYYNGKTFPELSTIVNIADVLGVSIEFLLGVDVQDKEERSKADYAREFLSCINALDLNIGSYQVCPENEDMRYDTRTQYCIVFDGEKPLQKAVNKLAGRVATFQTLKGREITEDEYVNLIDGAIEKFRSNEADNFSAYKSKPQVVGVEDDSVLPF
jgi:transcriptional regulator with XRE-family HTH domain